MLLEEKYPKAKRRPCVHVSDSGAKGRQLRKNQVMLIQQGSGEVVDWPDSTQRHGVVLSPQQVGAKHHSQVAVGHLVRFTVV